MNRADCLRAALESVSTKDEYYGIPEDNFRLVADLWTALGFTCNGDAVTSTDVVAAMILLKLARQSNAPKDDNWVDIAGYAACGAEVDTNAG